MLSKKKLKKLIKKSLPKRNTHALTDSHGLVFNNFKSNFFHQFNTCIIQGATVSGITNPNSQTQAYPRFKKYIENSVSKGDYIIVELGEVDCGFVLWYKAQNNKQKIENLLNITLDKYTEFLKLIIKKQKKPKRLFVLSTIPPTIKDNQTWGEVANLRKTIKATQKQRTELTLNFNKELQKVVKRFGATFIDLDNDLIDSKTRLVKDYYLNDNPLDHHLSQTKLSNLIMIKLKNEGLKYKSKITNE